MCFIGYHRKNKPTFVIAYNHGHVKTTCFISTQKVFMALFQLQLSTLCCSLVVLKKKTNIMLHLMTCEATGSFDIATEAIWL